VHPVLILLAGMVVVIGGVLVLRLHAFLALVLGGLCVAALTPQGAVYANEVRSASVEVSAVTGPTEDTLILSPGAKQKVLPGLNAALRSTASGRDTIFCMGEMISHDRRGGSNGWWANISRE